MSNSPRVDLFYSVFHPAADCGLRGPDRLDSISLPDDPVCLAWVPPRHHPGSLGGRPFHGEIVLQLQAASAVNAFYRSGRHSPVGGRHGCHASPAGGSRGGPGCGQGESCRSSDQISQAQADQEQLSQVIESQKKIRHLRFQPDHPDARPGRSGFGPRSVHRLPQPFSHEFPQCHWPGRNWRRSTASRATQDAQKKQEEADAARAAAQARADLLARAAKGEVTLSEMRQALIGKTRAEVSDLLGAPSETATDSWGLSPADDR